MSPTSKILMACLWAFTGALISAIVFLYHRVRDNERKVALVWSFLFRRAMIEALKQGFLTDTNPAKVRPDIRDRFWPIEADLKNHFPAIHPHDEPKLALEIEAKYQDWIVDNICLPCKMDRGECLVLAVEVAKEVTAKEKQQ